MPVNTPEHRPIPAWPLLPLARGLLALNGLFWIGLAGSIGFGGGTGLERGSALWWAALAGLLADGLLYFWTVWGLAARPFWFSLLGIGLSGLNLLLTLADQVGIWDLVLLALIALPGSLLVLQLVHLYRQRRNRPPPGRPRAG
jgi:hypothetical protein